MSGGVDSSVAALLLKKQGYEVIGLFMKNYSDTKNKLTGECNWIEDRKTAQKICTKLNIPLITKDFENEYKKQVINPMFKSYARGITPNPDIDCNAKIKFPLLWKEAKKLNIPLIATGHYAIIKKTKSNYELQQGKDPSKDQSYFLSELSQKDLEHTLFPIGNYTKEQIRKIAKENNFPNWDKHGSTGICFVGKINMQDMLKQRIKPNPGKVKDPDGKVMGTHQGISYYTIGQKANPSMGININKSNNSQSRFYIAEKQKNNTLIVAPENHPILSKKEIKISHIHLISKLPKSGLKARIRHLAPLIPGELKKQKAHYIFTLNKPTQGIAEGQSLVLYKNKTLIGEAKII